MPYLPEMIAAIVLLLAILIYFINKSSTNSEKKNILLAKFRKVREKSLHIQNAFTDYMMEHDAVNSKYTQEQTYGQFLNQLKKNHIYNLSEKQFKKVKHMKNVLSLKNVNRMLDQQNEKLDEIEKQFEATKK